MAKGGWMYIMANRYRGALYVGVTSDLSRRIWQHKNMSGSSYAERRGIDRIVYAEHYDRIDDAIAREKLVKRWHRPWKFRLIEEGNPDWLDLYDSLVIL